MESIAEVVADAVAGLPCPPGGEALGERAARPSAAPAVGDHLGQGLGGVSPSPGIPTEGAGWSGPGRPAGLALAVGWVVAAGRTGPDRVGSRALIER